MKLEKWPPFAAYISFELYENEVCVDALKVPKVYIESRCIQLSLIVLEPRTLCPNALLRKSKLALFYHGFMSCSFNFKYGPMHQCKFKFLLLF